MRGSLLVTHCLHRRCAVFPRVSSSLEIRSRWRGLAAQPAVHPSTSRDEPPLASPAPDHAEREYPDKIRKIVDEIASLSLLEVSDLNALLKKTLNIPDAPLMPAGGAMFAAGPGPAQQQDEGEETVSKKTSFTVKLMQFEDAKKISLIKEIKAIVPGLNLVQAKKFVESVPQVVKADVGRKDADELKDRLSALGATVEVE